MGPETIFLIVTLVLFIAALRWFFAVSRAPLEVGQRSFYFEQSGSTSDILSAVTHDIASGDRITIVGRTGSESHSLGSVESMGTLRLWLNAGAHIDYFAIDDYVQNGAAILALEDEFPSNVTISHVHETCSKCGGINAKLLHHNIDTIKLDYFRARHPMLIEGPAGEVKWFMIEGETHPLHKGTNNVNLVSASDRAVMTRWQDDITWVRNLQNLVSRHADIHATEQTA